MKRRKTSIIKGLIGWWRKLTHCPIHVYVFHHVSDSRDPLISGKPDWTQKSVFFSNLRALKKKYRFISLPSAYSKIKNDRIRLRKYAVLTTDDGLRTILSVIPWIEENGIPLTCFINAKYMDGVSYKAEDAVRIRREDADADIGQVIKGQYLKYNEVFALDSPLISMASHGFEHIDSTVQNEDDFKDNVLKCEKALENHPRFIRFFAYPWGNHSKMTDQILSDMDLVPVVVDGAANCNDASIIHRECIDGLLLS